MGSKTSRGIEKGKKMKLSRKWPEHHELNKAIANGCGTAGWKGKLVPDKIYGLRITPACQVHDVDYHFGKGIVAKDQADRTFLNNMIRIIEAKKRSWRWVTFLRLKRARKYYLSVKYFGGPAFWAGKK